MVIADFNVIVFGQKKPIMYIDDMYFVESYKIPVKSVSIYEKYGFIQQLNGVWYRFHPKERKFGDYSFEWFDLNIRSNRLNVMVLETYIKLIQGILNKCLLDSPNGYIGVIFRLEGYDKQNLRGVIKQNTFEKLLLAGKIKYNYIYIIQRSGKGKKTGDGGLS